MKGLLLKDFYVLTKQLKFFLIVVPILSLGSSNLFLALYLGAALPMTAFAYDERSKWNELAKMLPYSTKSIVMSKFVLGYITISACSLIAILGSVLTSVFIFNTNIIIFHIMPAAASSAFIFLAINNTIIFKFGTEKTRLFYIIFLVGAASLTAALTNPDTGNAAEIVLSSASVLVFAAVVINVIAIKVSLEIVKSKK